ncbi:MAG: MFS transporter [Myxococcota bacterium]
MTQEVGYIELFRRNTDFRNLFFGRLISLFGDWFNLLAILAMLRAFGDESALSFAGVLVVKTLPAVVAPAAGVLVDRLPRRALMMGADALRALVVVCMLGLVWVPSIPLLYALVVAQTLLGSLFEPARNAILPDLVRPEELTAANTATAASWSLMLALGAATGGVFTELFGWQAALVLDASTYVVSVAFLAFIKDPPRTTPAASVDLWDSLGVRDLWQGAAWLTQRPRVWSLALVKPVWQVTGARTLVLTLLGEGAFSLAGYPLLGVTLLYVGRGIGTGVGPFVARALTKSRPAAMEKAIWVGFLMGGVFYVALGVAPALWVAIIAVIFAHLGGATIWVFSSIRLQQLVPSRVRGRVFSAEHAGFTFIMAASISGFGPLGDGLPLWLADVGWVSDWGGPKAVTGRILAVGLGALTLIPLVLWGVRGALLGWAGVDSAESDDPS